MKEHVLKTWPEPFLATLSGDKVHEFRKDDRGYEMGDVLVLREWAPNVVTFNDAMAGAHPRTAGVFTGHQVRRRVTYISRGPAFGIPEGFVVMSLASGVPSVRELPPVERGFQSEMKAGLL